MKRKPDWADKLGEKLAAVHQWTGSGIEYPDPKTVARALRAAERRGFKRAVKMLREGGLDRMDYSARWADWLEEQKP